MIKGVVHCKRKPFDVYIGRPSIWGNPFEIGDDGDRDEVIEKYREHLMNSPQLLARLHELDGMVLGCWCKPKRCHGDVLREVREQQIKEEEHARREAGHEAG